MIFNGLVVDIRMESATFGCAAVDSVEESLGVDRKMMAVDVKIMAAGVEMMAAGVEMMAAGGGWMRGGAYLQPSLYITLLAPLVSCSASGCSAMKLSMWRMRFSSSISSMAIRMPVSSTSPNP